jgi:hypothetical protein
MEIFIFMENELINVLSKTYDIIATSDYFKEPLYRGNEPYYLIVSKIIFKPKKISTITPKEVGHSEEFHYYLNEDKLVDYLTIDSFSWDDIPILKYMSATPIINTIIMKKLTEMAEEVVLKYLKKK